MSTQLPEPRLTKVYRLDATLGSALDVGDVDQGRRRIVPLTGGTFTGPAMSGKLLPGPAPTGRSSRPMAPRSGTSVTRSRPIAANFFMCNHEESAMVAL